MPKFDDPLQDTGDPYVYRENEPLSGAEYALVQMLFARHPARAFELVLEGLKRVLELRDDWALTEPNTRFITEVIYPHLLRESDSLTLLMRVALVIAAASCAVRDLEPRR